MTYTIGTKLVVTFKKDLTTIKGTTFDTSATYIHIENDTDFYSIPMDEVFVTEVTDTTETHANNEQHIAGRDIKKTVARTVKAHWNELEDQYVQVYNFEVDGVEGYDVEVISHYEDGDISTNCTDTFGAEKDAIKRAKQVAKMLNLEYKGIYTL